MQQAPLEWKIETFPRLNELLLERKSRLLSSKQVCTAFFRITYLVSISKWIAGALLYNANFICNFVNLLLSHLYNKIQCTRTKWTFVLLVVVRVGKIQPKQTRRDDVYGWPHTSVCVCVHENTWEGTSKIFFFGIHLDRVCATKMIIWRHCRTHHYRLIVRHAASLPSSSVFASGEKTFKSKFDYNYVPQVLKTIEDKWKARVDEHWKQKLASHKDGQRAKYILSMFPYPSGNLHLGLLLFCSISFLY